MKRKGTNWLTQGAFGTDKDYAEIGCWCELARPVASSDTAE